MKRYVFAAIVFAAVMASAVYPCGAEGSADIQQAIDAAEPGTIVEVPAGVYEGAIVLKDGVWLVGEGAESTVLDGGGANAVVVGGKDSAILGFTIRNGLRGIDNGTNSIGVFECHIKDCKRTGIWLYRGFAAIANNLVEGNGKNTGIAAYSSNPFVSNNLIADHHTGLLVAGHFSPTVVANTFVRNQYAIRVAGQAKLELADNIFVANQNNIKGHAMGATDVISDQVPELKVPHQGASVQDYQELMRVVSEEKVAEHPVVVYTLGKETGVFGMAALYPWATFSVGTSTKDTRVAAYDALDLVTTGRLNSEYKQLGRPTVLVNNPEVTGKEADRYALDCLFRHPDSYYRETDGNLVFRRMTNFSRIEVTLPVGYQPVSINYPASVEVLDGQTVVKITDVGHTLIEIVLSDTTPPGQ